LSLPRFPARSTYFNRYRNAHRIFETVIREYGREAIEGGLVDASVVAVDKSLLTARGPAWHKKHRKKNRLPPNLHGVDRDSEWGFSTHHGWVQGYSYEVVVSASEDGPVWPLLASVNPANACERTTFQKKIDQLPNQTHHVLADGGGR